MFSFFSPHFKTRIESSSSSRVTQYRSSKERQLGTRRVAAGQNTPIKKREMKKKIEGNIFSVNFNSSSANIIGTTSTTFLPNLRRIIHLNESRPTLSQFWSFKIRHTTFLSYIKFNNLLILKLLNRERASRDCFSSSNVRTRTQVGSLDKWILLAEWQHLHPSCCPEINSPVCKSKMG